MAGPFEPCTSYQKLLPAHGKDMVSYTTSKSFLCLRFLNIKYNQEHVYLYKVIKEHQLLN